MTRVAFLLGNLTDGGSETKTVGLANRFAARGREVHVIYLGEPHTLRSRIDENVKVEFLDRRGKFSFRAYRRLKSYLRDNDIDMVICINHYPLVYGWPACRFGDRRRRCVGAMNTYEFTSLRDRFFMLIYAFILRRCDRVVFGSRAQKRLWIDRYRLRSDSGTVIYNGVDIEYFSGAGVPSGDLRASLGISSSATIIGCVAHLRPEKSHEDLLAAMKRLVQEAALDCQLLLVGDGPEEPRLREYVASNQLTDRVRFCGRANDVRPFLELMDVFVLPSSSEVFPNAVLEAMASGIPVVCTAVGGAIEMVEDGETGYTYPRHDVDQLVRLLESLAGDRETRDRFGRNGAARARLVFSLDSMDRQYASLIEGSSSATGRD